MRIDPLGTNGAGGQYGIPPTNPFVGTPGALAEIYAYGLHEPYRFSWDPSGRNRMLLGNMGQVVYDHDPPSGWPCDRDSGHAVIGGFVYRGEGMPDFRGKYMFGDGVDGRIFYADAGEMRRGDNRLAKVYEFLLLDGTGKQVTMQDLAGDLRVDLRFGSGSDGALTSCPRRTGKSGK